MSLSHVSFSIAHNGRRQHAFISQYVPLVQGNAIANLLGKIRSPFPSKYMLTCHNVNMGTLMSLSFVCLCLSFSPELPNKDIFNPGFPVFFHRVYVKPIHENLLHNKLTHIPTKRAFHKLSISAYQFLRGRLIYIPNIWDWIR